MRAGIKPLTAAALMRRLTELDLIDDANAIIKKHGARWPEVAGRSIQPPDVAARHEIMHLIKRRYPAWSAAMIGRLFDRDHATVLEALRKFAP